MFYENFKTGPKMGKNEIQVLIHLGWPIWGMDTLVLSAEAYLQNCNSAKCGNQRQRSGKITDLILLNPVHFIL